jgi:alkylation response protein AidB-like acyl-CoA dehydrogenase
MRFALNSEQQELQELARRFFQTESSLTDVRQVIETPTGYNPKVWQQLGELGLTGLIVAEDYGGAGASMVEVAVLLREAGRVLFPAPLLANTIAAATLGGCADEQVASALLPDIASGAVIATLALSDEAGSVELDDTGVTARLQAGYWRIDGSKGYVLHGTVADLFLVTATTPNGVGLFTVPADSAGLVATPLPALDPTRTLAALSFAGTLAQLVTTDRSQLENALQVAAVCLAAEQVGGAQAALDSAVDYAKTRQQFGRPIGSFQALKHLLADVLLEVESAKAASDYAAWAAASAPTELAMVASLAKAFCSDTYLQAASVNLQVHGGMGFTWEADAHLHLKRAITTKQLLGSPELHRERLAALDLDRPAPGPPPASP